jgi:photosystem II stability/assembly factor-like uncharacterized protein
MRPDQSPIVHPTFLPFLLMAATLLIGGATLLTPGTVQAQDVPTTVPTWERVRFAPVADGRHDDIKFVSPDKGWMVNTRGEIWHTPDAGFSWLLQHKETSVAFRSTAFKDERVGWAGTVFSPGSVLWETRDGGAHWTNISHRIEGQLPDGICGMVAVSADVAYGVGAFHGAPTVVKTTNGGITWTGRSVADVASTLIDVHFFDENTGIATGGTGSSLDGDAVVIRTEDGGETWTRVYRSTRGPSISGEWGWKISFPTPEVGYISVETINNPSGLDAKVLKTVDGGRTWTPLSVTGSVSSAGLQGIGFITPDIGWASGRGVTSLTTDGGVTWQQLQHYNQTTQTGQLDGAINRFYMVNESLAYAIGQRTYRISGYGNVGTDIELGEAVPDRFTLGTSYPNPFTDQVNLPYTLDEAAPVRFSVIDVTGRLVHEGPLQTQPPGSYTFTWNGKDKAGRDVASGTYLVLIDIGSSPEMKQVVFVR